MVTTYRFYQNKKSTKKGRSRYVQGGVSQEFKAKIKWWERDPSIFAERTDDTDFTITPEFAGREDLIANFFWGNAVYSWLILQYNNIVDSAEELVAGKTIRIPSDVFLNSIKARTKVTLLNGI